MTGQAVADGQAFSMNTRRSYLDTLNTGRQRRPEPTFEDLDRTLAALEGRGDRPAQPRRAESAASREERYRAMPSAARAGSYASDLKALAQEMDRARRQEDGLTSASRIATELKSMRDEMRQQMTNGLKREFDALRQDLQRLAAAKPAVGADELGVEFERLSDAVRNLAERSDDRSVNMLRLELEQVKGALDSLAREDTLKSVGRRWDEFDRKFSSLETKVGEPGIKALSAQLDRINETVSGLPESLSMRSLDERLRVLANSVEHFAAQYANAMPEAFALIEQRLDEISRAIVASSTSQRMANFDPEPFQRIEARVTSLARQIDELMDERPSGEVLDRLSLLSERVDQIAQRVDIPEAIVERLGSQIAHISDRLESTSQPSTELIFRGLEDRFSDLAAVLERRQGDAAAEGHQLFRDLERRLDQVAQRIDERQATTPSYDAELIEAIERRFGDLTARLQGSTGGDRQAIVGLETRLDDISRQLDQAARRVDAIDPDLVRNLEQQVAALSAHLTRPGAPLPEFEDLGPRLDHIERSLAGNRDAIVEAARRAAQEAVSATHAGTGDGALVAFSAELKAIEAMTRRSDERNAKTFEAIHEMLLKVVDRLGSLEQSGAAPRAPARPAAPATPAVDSDEAERVMARATGRTAASPARSPADAAAAAANHALGETKAAVAEPEGKRNMLSGLTRAFRREKEPQTQEPIAEAPVEPELRLDEPLDPRLANQPLEPGSGAPDLSAIVRRVRDETGNPTSAEAAKSDFIAAARRAAQAAAAEAQTSKRGSDLSSAGAKLKLGGLMKNRRKGVLMAATALIVVFGAWQLGRAFIGGDTDADFQMTETTEQAEPVMLSEVMEPRAAAEQAEQTAEAEPTEVADPAEAPAVRIADSASTQPVQAAALPASAVVPMPNDPAPATFVDPVVATGSTLAPAEAGPVALREAADGGDPKAMFEIGSRYAEGRGVKANMATASQWYGRSAELGYAPAQYRMGNFFEKGTGVDRDPAAAMTWYDKAAKQGNASAMHNLAVLHAMGAAGAPDNDAAARWFQEAADLGITDSQYNLGILAAKGAGVAQNLEESYKWFALVARTGDRDAATKRDEVAKALRPEQLAKAKAATELWKPRGVDPETNVVDIPEEWSEGDTPTASVADMKAAVRNIQAILNKNGYDAGGADGLMGAKTKNAIKAFQADNGMTADGQVTEALVKALLARQ